MITYFLGEEQVAAYSLDFVRRLTALESTDFPRRWFALGQSGEKMAARLLGMLPDDLQKTIRLSLVGYDRRNKKVIFEDSIDGVRFGRAPVLIVDSAVHSGRSMLAIIDTLQGAGARHLLSYTLVLKKGALLIPSYFGVMIDDKDRAYFDLEALPNNRLHNKPAFGTLREISEGDVALKLPPVGAPFRGLTAGDLIYDKQALSFKAFIYTLGSEIAGFVTFKKSNSTLFIDSVGVPKKHQGKKIGGALLRWSETWARANACDSIELWAFEKAVPLYEGFEYTFADDVWRSLGGGQRYRIMRKKILYNVRPRDE